MTDGIFKKFQAETRTNEPLPPSPHESVATIRIQIEGGRRQ
jgi:hypothetical protein